MMNSELARRVKALTSSNNHHDELSAGLLRHRMYSRIQDNDDDSDNVSKVANDGIACENLAHSSTLASLLSSAMAACRVPDSHSDCLANDCARRQRTLIDCPSPATVASESSRLTLPAASVVVAASSSATCCSSLTPPRRNCNGRQYSYDCNYEYSQERAYEEFGVERELLERHPAGALKMQQLQKQRQQLYRDPHQKVYSNSTDLKDLTCRKELERQTQSRRLLESIVDPDERITTPTNSATKKKKKHDKQRRRQQPQPFNETDQRIQGQAGLRTQSSPSISGPNLQLPWLLSPFQKSRSLTFLSPSKRANKKNANDNTATVVPAAVNPSFNNEFHQFNLSYQQRRKDQNGKNKHIRATAPVDIDEVSIESYEHPESSIYLPDIDSSDGADVEYHSAPTELYIIVQSSELGNMGGGLDTPISVGSITTGCENVIATDSRKCLENERVLSQLGMEVHQEDNYSNQCYRSECSFSGNGVLNNFMRESTSTLKFDSGEQEFQDQQKQLHHNIRELPRSIDDPTSTNSKTTCSNLKESMKKINHKARQTIGTIMNKVEGENSDEDNVIPNHNGTGNRLGHSNSFPCDNNNLGNNEKSNTHVSRAIFRSKILSALRGHHHMPNPRTKHAVATTPVSSSSTSTLSIPQQVISITPSSSEDPEMHLTFKELQRVQQWQMARARREGNTWGSRTAPWSSKTATCLDSIKSGNRCGSNPVDVDEDESTGSGEKDALSMTASSYSDITTVMDNRKLRKHKTDYSV